MTWVGGEPWSKRLHLVLGVCGVAFVVASLLVVVHAIEPAFTVVTPTRLTVAEWQRAIDRQNYLVRLVLDERLPEAAAGQWRGSFDGEPIRFEVREQPLPPDLPVGATTWRFALSIPEALDTRSRLAGAMALVAYGLSSGGSLFVEGYGRVAPLESWASYVDIEAALGVGKRDEAVARYPGRVRPVGADGAIVTTIFRD